MTSTGTKDGQTVLADGRRASPPAIAGVAWVEINNVLTRSGVMAEVFRTDWPVAGISVRQVNWVALAPGAVTDWHRHELQTDHLVAVGGNIKLCLWDGRPDSPTVGASETIRFGALHMLMVRVPPGVWHGLRNESGVGAGYINMVDQHFAHARPDSWRLPAGAAGVPDIL